MHTITNNYALKWQINFATHYKVTKCGKVINMQRCKILKRCVNGGQIGYWIAGKWYSLTNLRKHLVKIDRFKLPF